MWIENPSLGFLKASQGLSRSDSEDECYNPHQNIIEALHFFQSLFSKKLEKTLRDNRDLNLYVQF